MRLLNFILLFIGTFLYTSLNAQQTGKVDYPELGISFVIPPMWAGQEGGEGYYLGSETVPGFILITTHTTKSLEQLKNDASGGFVDGTTILNKSGEYESVTPNSVGAIFTGSIEGHSAKAYIIGMVNPEDGYGISIFSATTTEAFTDENKKAAVELAKSVVFSKAVMPSSVDKWKKDLQNARLTYMDSYSSYDYSGDYTTGGGYSSEERIDLCAQGFFNFYSSSSMSVDEGGAYGSSHGNDQGNGDWKVIANAQGEAVLQLNFLDGSVKEYVITESEGKTLLNGYRYFRTYGTVTDDGPDCN